MQLKLIERAWRKAWVRVLSRALARTRGTRSSRTAARRRVLFLRPDRIGDMIVSTGVLHAISQSDPAIELDVRASPANAPVARGQPFIRDVIVFDRKRPWRGPAMLVRLRAAEYDAVVDCMPTSIAGQRHG